MNNQQPLSPINSNYHRAIQLEMINAVTENAQRSAGICFLAFSDHALGNSILDPKKELDPTV